MTRRREVERSGVRMTVRPAPPGMYIMDGRLVIRRFAPIRPRELVCRNGHRVKVSHRPLVSTPQCDFRYKPSNQQCQAHLYIYRLTPLRYLSLDITREEADMIHNERLDIDDVIAHFGLDMPRAA